MRKTARAFVDEETKRLEASARAKAWQAANPERAKETQRRCYAAKRAQYLARNATSAAKWRLGNPDRHAAKEAARRAAVLQATPPWADLEEIGRFYEMAAVLSMGGVKHHVDHIVPLKGKTVCGFHTEGNLQVVAWHWNLSKSNRLLPPTSCTQGGY